MSGGYSTLRTDDYVKAQLVRVGYSWGHEYGGHLGALLIISCLATRQRFGWGSWLDVIDKIPYYSAQEEIPNITPSVWDPSFVRILHEVESIYSGSGQDYAKGGIYWADLRRINRPWFREKVVEAKKEDGSPEHARVVDMNTLVIFK